MEVKDTLQLMATVKLKSIEIKPKRKIKENGVIEALSSTTEVGKNICRIKNRLHYLKIKHNDTVKTRGKDE